MRKSTAVTVLGAAAAMMVGFSGIASAGTIGIPGVSGALYASSNTLYVKDAACDDDSVYAQWQTQGGQVQRLNNTSGCGTTVSSRLPMGDGTTILWRVCVDKSWPTSDSCSAWKSEKI
ncbi:hypothetical protein [Amycolatopsis sp. lyj-108]|uniref:hypothetical protein n=1 Tax=Amycolatopsis sp. lyj-108 TaxID=2789286 RepID=UPI00397972E6